MQMFRKEWSQVEEIVMYQETTTLKKNKKKNKECAENTLTSITLYLNARKPNPHFRPLIMTSK